MLSEDQSRYETSYDVLCGIQIDLMQMIFVYIHMYMVLTYLPHPWPLCTYDVCAYVINPRRPWASRGVIVVLFVL